eukprot:TRINITY_DN76780_c0_g1_i1.p1 TRINITY_DN76780_c0_g1~~TRINITY_DN76780_c0_g1_i1.p1  ORF type:complete len:297 (+),score=19.78 TRINITY_DN76780_c0_g1_i1:27-917(+)
MTVAGENSAVAPRPRPPLWAPKRISPKKQPTPNQNVSPAPGFGVTPRFPDIKRDVTTPEIDLAAFSSFRRWMDPNMPLSPKPPSQRRPEDAARASQQSKYASEHVSQSSRQLNSIPRKATIDKEALALRKELHHYRLARLAYKPPARSCDFGQPKMDSKVPAPGTYPPPSDFEKTWPSPRARHDVPTPNDHPSPREPSYIQVKGQFHNSLGPGEYEVAPPSALPTIFSASGHTANFVPSRCDRSTWLTGDVAKSVATCIQVLPTSDLGPAFYNAREGDHWKTRSFNAKLNKYKRKD